MALLFSRQSGHSFSTIQERPVAGWDFCMTKAYCKWPAIVGIIIAIIALIFSIICCVRCCGCCGCGRKGRARKNAQPSMFNPMPYQGYQPANANHAPPPYNEPPQFAQIDNHGGSRKGGEDSLPAMPSWDSAQSKRVEDHEDVELGRIPPTQKGSTGPDASTTHLAQSNPGYAEADSHPVSGPHEVPTTGYTGPDFGVAHGQQTAYSAYTPSESTRYEPSRVNEPQELGTTYSHTLPPPSPSAQQQGFQHAPSVLQAGRRPGQGQSQGAWRDV